MRAEARGTSALSTSSDLDWTMTEYQIEAMRSAAPYPTDDMTKAIRALGIAGEAGEFADLVKKEVGHGHPVDRTKIAKELGDVLWYVATLADAYGLTLDEVARGNIAKLRSRYPEGFTSEASLARVDAHG